MYTLYWAPGCGSFAPHAALNEVRAQFDLIEVDLDSNQHHTPEFLAINPRAQVPVLALSDGTVITESVAMMMHIADCHPQFVLMPQIGEARRAMAYRWLVFCAVSLYEAGCRISHPQYYTFNASDNDGIRDKALNDLNKYWTIVADAIGDGPFLFGCTYSVVDICLLMITQWHPNKDELLRRLPKLATLCNAVRERPAIDEIWNLNFPDC
ncbi:MAG: glutathione S-transferase family protein [Rhodospirillales bacterium]|nr:glutathione S-transferase family protein [Rhodospirillales bacterium]